MNPSITVTQSQLPNLLLNVAVVRPVFIWGAPGIGKSSLVELFALEVGLECVSLLGSQLAPEDLIGVPQIVDGKSRFCPPITIARDEPYCLFLDELNACSHEVQKAFDDQGYMPPEVIVDKVKGRGGTVLQPALDLLERAPDFPKSGPVLIITDGWCDRLRIRRDHAFLLPKGNHLPFVPKGNSLGIE